MDACLTVGNYPDGTSSTFKSGHLEEELEKAGRATRKTADSENVPLRIQKAVGGRRGEV